MWEILKHLCLTHRQKFTNFQFGAMAVKYEFISFALAWARNNRKPWEKSPKQKTNCHHNKRPHKQPEEQPGNRKNLHWTVLVIKTNIRPPEWLKRSVLGARQQIWRKLCPWQLEPNQSGAKTAARDPVIHGTKHSLLIKQNILSFVETDGSQELESSYSIPKNDSEVRRFKTKEGMI